MRDVYEDAVQTVIWLGESDKSTGKVMAGLDRIGGEAIAAGFNDLEEGDIKRWPDLGSAEGNINIKNRLMELIPRRTTGFPLRDLIDISNRPWFTRAWVQQELAVLRDFMFMCGKWTAPGENFITGFTFCLLWMAEEFRSLTQGGSLSHLPFRILKTWWRNGWSFLRVVSGDILWQACNTEPQGCYNSRGSTKVAASPAAETESTALSCFRPGIS